LRSFANLISKTFDTSSPVKIPLNLLPILGEYTFLSYRFAINF